MISTLKEYCHYPEEMRKTYCRALIEIAKVHPEIVTVDCDLSSSCGTKDFAKTFPDRAFDIGIQEQNAAAMAGGLSASGLIPFVHTFGVFASRRVADQVFLSGAYAGQNVKILGFDPGITATSNGGTHMAIEDTAIMRAIPEVTVLEPSDPVMLKSLLPQIVETKGTMYLRMNRKQVRQIYEEGSSFQLGKAAVLREGNDVTLIAMGIEVGEALDAAVALEKEGISTQVVDMFTVKPLDIECVIRCAEKTGTIVTCENANIIGGLGSAVAEVLAEHCPVPMERIGIRDIFGEVGDMDYLMEHFHLRASDIVEKAKKAIDRKGRRS